MKRWIATGLSLLVSVGGLTALAAGPAAAGGSVTQNFDCQASTPVGTQQLTQTFGIAVSAPSSVTPGATFTVSASTDPGMIPAQESGINVNSARNFAFIIPVPANSAFVSSSLSGGSGLGNGTPGIGLQGNKVVLNVPGPIGGGATFQFPTVNVTLKATGPIGSSVAPAIGGTSYSDPGLSFTINLAIPVLGNTDVPVSCFPSPVQTLATTNIVADTTPPTAAITAPADGASYLLGSQIPAQYSCADEQYGSGVASCAGTVSDGSPFDASTLGAKSFAVVATDNAGNITTTTSNYSIIAPAGDQTPPTVTISSPPQGAVYRTGQVIPASFACSDAGSGVASCIGTVPNGSAIDTSSAGVKSFTVNATDLAGNPQTVVNSYRVLTASTGPIGPVNVGSIGGCCVNFTWHGNATATLKVSSPAPNGGQLKVGDQVTVEWSIFHPTLGVGATSNWGPDPLNWSVPAPSNTTIVGPITADENGLNGETHSNAHAGGNSTGPTSVSADSGGNNVNMVWDENSVPAAIPIQNGDGILMHMKFTAQVTAPGPVSILGFPAMSGTDCGAFGAGCGGFTTDAGPSTAAIGISYNAIDTTPPTVSVSAPSNGALYTPNAVVPAAYTCSDDVALASCAGDVVSGNPINTAVSGPHQFHVTAIDSSGNSTQKVVTYTVIDPTVSASDCQATEGGVCTFTVSLSNPSNKTVTVSYGTGGGTATPTADYTPVSGTLAFNPGTSQATVAVPVIDDNVIEPDETFTLLLSSPTNAILGANGTGTIHDGTVTYTLGFTDSEWSQYLAVTSAMNIDPAQFPVLSLQFINYITGGAPATPSPAPPPSNSGPHSLVVPMTQAFNAGTVGPWSTYFGQAPPALLKTSVLFLEYLWLISGH